MTLNTPQTGAQAAWEALAEQAKEAKDAIAQWEAYYKRVKEQLMELHKQGYAPSKFEHAGLTFTLQEGRKSVTFDNEYKAKISLLQEEALSTGHAVVKQGESFWTIKEAK